jgi:hypothetical protein
MTDNKMQPNVNDRPEPAKLEQMSQQSRQSQANTSDQPGQRAMQGRRPLFRQ